METTTSFGDSMGSTFGNSLGRIVGFLPHLIAAAVILVVGLLIAWGLGGLFRRLLHGARFDRFLERHGVLRPPAGDRGSLTVGRVVFWVVALVTFVAAADSLQLSWVSLGLAKVTSYLPNVLAAALVILGAYILGNLVHRAILRMRPGAPPMTADLMRGAIYVLAGFMALQQLGIAVGIVTLCFGLLVGAMAVAAAVAFGIGNRELAGRVTREWYERHRAPLRREPLPTEQPVEGGEFYPPVEPQH
jgi:hypothetical protein